MSKLVKLSIGVGVLAGLYLLYDFLTNAIDKFDYAVSKFGKPKLSGNTLSVPLAITFKNPTNISLSLDNIDVKIYLLRNGQWVYASQVNQPLSIPAGTSDQVITPSVDIKAILGGNLSDTISFIREIITTKKVTIKTETQAVYKGVKLPVVKTDAQEVEVS